jgi:hypothetical protein
VLGSAEGSGRGLDESAVRLTRAARAGGAAFVAIAPTVPVAQLRLASSIATGGYRWRRNPFGEPVDVVAVTVRVAAQSLGWSGQTELRLPVLGHSQRDALDPMAVDRRGVRKPASKAVRSRRWARV